MNSYAKNLNNLKNKIGFPSNILLFFIRILLDLRTHFFSVVDPLFGQIQIQGSVPRTRGDIQNAIA